MINGQVILRSILVGCTLIGGLAFSQTVLAQNQSRQDSTMVAIRLHGLKKQKADLQKKIEIEDGKRNQSIEGVSAEAMEKINLTQDSICLELRSRLVDIELEIAELTPDRLPTQLIQQYNRLRQSQTQSSSGSPSKK